MAPKVPRSAAEHEEEVAQLRRDLEAAQQREAEARDRERVALEHQTATSEILTVIAASPPDLPTVFTALAERALRRCRASAARVWQVEDALLRCVASAGTTSRVDVVGLTMPRSSHSMAGRTVIDGRLLHIGD